MQIQTHRSKETSIHIPETKHRYHWRIHQYRTQEHVHLKQYVKNCTEHQYTLQNTKLITCENSTFLKEETANDFQLCWKVRNYYYLYRCVNISRNSTHFAAGSWSVGIKPRWDFNRGDVCEFNGLWADREAFLPNTDILKSKLPHYYTSWKFWKTRDWSGHDNSNADFNINVIFKYSRNKSWIHVRPKNTGQSVFDISWFNLCGLKDQGVEMKTSLRLVPIVRKWESVTSLFHLPSLPYAEKSVLITDFIFIMHSIIFLSPGAFLRKSAQIKKGVNPKWYLHKSNGLQQMPINLPKEVKKISDTQIKKFKLARCVTVKGLKQGLHVLQLALWPWKWTFE